MISTNIAKISGKVTYAMKKSLVVTGEAKYYFVRAASGAQLQLVLQREVSLHARQSPR